MCLKMPRPSGVSGLFAFFRWEGSRLFGTALVAWAEKKEGEVPGLDPVPQQTLPTYPRQVGAGSFAMESFP